MRNKNPHYRLTAPQIAAFENYLRTEEREQSTIEKYLRNIRIFAAWLGDAPVTKSTVIAWKEHLLAEKYTEIFCLGTKCKVFGTKCGFPFVSLCGILMHESRM